MGSVENGLCCIRLTLRPRASGSPHHLFHPVREGRQGPQAHRWTRQLLVVRRQRPYHLLCNHLDERHLQCPLRPARPHQLQPASIYQPGPRTAPVRHPLEYTPRARLPGILGRRSAWLVLRRTPVRHRAAGVRTGCGDYQRCPTSAGYDPACRARGCHGDFA